MALIKQITNMILLCAGAVLLPHFSAFAQSQKPVELELVLAIDTSTSVNAFEFSLQKGGLANAFRHPSVIQAIKAVGGEGIAVSVVQWSGELKHLTSVDWMLIQNENDARRFAKAIDAIPRKLRGLTDIGSAISFSLKQIKVNEFEGVRKVIDISGDGTSGGTSLQFERARAIAHGITINGLAILEPNPDLWEFGLMEHYVNEVIGGQGAFLMSADSFEDFAEVIRRKLIREIVGFSLAALDD